MKFLVRPLIYLNFGNPIREQHFRSAKSQFMIPDLSYKLLLSDRVAGDKPQETMARQSLYNSIICLQAVKSAIDVKHTHLAKYRQVRACHLVHGALAP